MPTYARAAIVTGSSKGIGAAVALRLAADGFAVVVNYSSSAAPAEELVRKIEGAGGSAIAIKANVGEAAQVAELFAQAEQAFGGVDVLVNNAGIMKLAPLAETTDELFDQTISVNLKGTFNGMREAARRLREGGRIISFSSSVVGLFQPTYAAYAATKAAIEAMSRILSKELGDRRITVNAVAPGPVATELFLQGKGDDDIKPIVGRTPLARLGEPVDIARVVSFLAGPDGAWINGQVLRANGGII
ncbi:SDR family oxidoreductase [Lichenicoccus sp.]|uniref:SDR family oxidoreductase n=1 Tax=Lichenicoccus sp. TaxID=2781899 RepID=UPI003D09D0A4